MRSSVVLLAFALCAVNSGCALFLPPHRNSEYTSGEVIRIEMIEATTLGEDPELRADFKAAFGLSDDELADALGEVEAEVADAAAAGAAALVGAGIDFIEKQLRREATRYEAQFGSVLTEDQFWVASTVRTKAWEELVEVVTTTEEDGSGATTKKVRSETRRPVTTPTRMKPRFAAFRVTRTVPGYEGTTPAFELICGFCPSLPDRQLFRIAPLRFQTRVAKAKVLSDELWWWFLPTTWMGKLLRNQGHEIDTTVAIELDAYWKDEDQHPHIDKVAAFTLPFPAYDIGDAKLLRAAPKAGTDEQQIPPGPAGWVMSMPVSYGTEFDNGQRMVKPVGRGSFTLTANVIERDRSNAAEFLVDAAELVAENREKAVEAAEKFMRAQFGGDE